MNYQKLGHHFLENNAFARELGITITEVRDGFALGELTMREEMTNFSKGLHGGVYFTLADTLAGIASKTRGKSSVTLEGKMNFLRSVKEGKIVGKAEMIHQGKRTGVYEAKVFDEADNLLAVATYTFYILDQEIVLE